jgi:DNA-binding NtrC family response regulator
VAARSKDHIMIQGPSGSGKELAAAAIHQGSTRAKGPFVARNVANITSSLVPSELFGNLKNYPNPGMPARDGIVGAADGGTLFLDEIGDCSLDIQTSLMRLLDSGAYEPVGDGTSRRADVRLIGATNRDNSAFKHDFVARFLTRVRIPPLRERREDIPLLARHWLLRRAREAPEEAGRFIQTGPSGRPEPRVSGRLIDHLVRHTLRLNVRELHALLLVAMRASKGDVVKNPRPDLTTAETPPPPSGAEAGQMPSELRSPSKEEIVACLEREKGNVSRAAEALRMDRSTLRRRMKSYGIT